MSQYTKRALQLNPGIPATPRIFRIPFALRAGRPIHVSEVASGFHNDCLCPECRKPLIAKKGDRNAHHFAHRGQHNCNAETILHLLAKQILKHRIEMAIATQEPLPLRWVCSRCQSEHQGNLVKRARTVRIETQLHGKVPDLTLIDQSGEACGVIEVVVTHSIEPQTRAVYLTRRIPIVEFHVQSVDDLITFRDSTDLGATAVSFCPVPDWQLQTIKLANLPVRLDQITIEQRGSVLIILDRYHRGTGQGSLKGKFVFDRDNQAQLALTSLQTGAIDGLNEPGWMLTQCKNRILHRDLISEIAHSLREYQLDWRGFGKIKWRRPHGHFN